MQRTGISIARFSIQLACWIVVLCMNVLFPVPEWAQNKRPITAKDCATMRDVMVDGTTWQSTIRISPDGKRVAYLVRSPNLETNANDIELRVLDLPSHDGEFTKPILVGDISEAHWTDDSRHMLVLMRSSAGRAIFLVDAETGDHSVLFRAKADIAEYSTDAQIKTIVYATEVPAGGTRPTMNEKARGYRIPFPQVTAEAWPRRRVFVVHRTFAGWSAPVEVVADSPLNGQRIAGFNHAGNSALNLSVAPNGRSVLISYFDFSDTMPEEWRSSGFFKLRETNSLIGALVLLVEYDLTTGKLSIPFKTPWVVSKPVWSQDSNFFLVAAAAPIGSSLEREDVASHALGHGTKSRLYRVDVQSGNFEVVSDRLAFAWEGALDWPHPDEIWLQNKAMNGIEKLVRSNGAWRETRSIELPHQGNLYVTTNGQIIIGSFSDADMSPELFSYDPDSQHWSVLVELNPQLDQLTFAQSQEVHWQTSTGFQAEGVLLLPPDYLKGKRYPVVIQTKPFAHAFTCSIGDFPSFAPEPIANAGIMYLGVVQTEGLDQNEEDFYPKDYPGAKGGGSLSEAAFNMDLWDTAVDALDRNGLIDRNKVGIIGFSRTGWYTEFLLAHARTHYAAATVADNVQYSVGEYWLNHDPETMNESNQLYGGPPYGNSLKNWIDYSVSFNLDRIHTPLLMEEMGHGNAYDDPNVVPVDLAAAFEVFTGLNAMSKPVEMYYYPNESHTPEHPLAKFETMQRNVDWYRFWLQGYERPNPEDPDQYKRWEHLRGMRDADAKATGQAQGEASKPN